MKAFKMKNWKHIVFITVLSFSLLVFREKVISQSVNNVIPLEKQGPCDIYSAAGCPCVAAHSTARSLYSSYTGPLYQVMRQSDGKTLDIGIVKPGKGEPGRYANAAAQDAFCTGTLCWITKIYDQSGKGNHLMQAPPGTFKGPGKGAFNTLPIADMAPITISGHKAYGVYIMPGMGLRNNNASDISINDEAEGIYYVINGKHYSSGCCFDYGNSSTNSRAVGTGTMETTYYGTATAWGSGNGPGPWIMADMEAGLFSGYNAKKNDVPSIDSWQFVSAFVNGGDGNKWDLRGGNAQQGGLTTFYSGVRPGTPDSKAYFPMNKKGGILLGNGGDNGNGSAGTFYEGVMTRGFPTEATTDEVQANIVAAKYEVQLLNLSRLTSFTPKSTQEVIITFTNSTGIPVKDVKLSLVVPKRWNAFVSGSANSSKTFSEAIAANASVSVTFQITSPVITDAGFLSGKAEWTSLSNVNKQSDIITQRIRNSVPVKINEVRFNSENNPTNQFIELYNASANEVDISNWNIIHTPSEWAPVRLVSIPTNTKLSPHSFYLLGLSASGLMAPANPGVNTINVRSTEGFEVGQTIDVDGEVHKIAGIGTAASPMTTIFIPVSTGPWLSFPIGTTNLPVTNATGFAVGQKIGIDLGGNYEIATVSSVGKAATQTSLVVAAKAGDVSIKVYDNVNMTVGDILTINTGARIETIKVKRIVNVVSAPVRGVPNNTAGEIELAAPLKYDHMIGVDVAGPGTGVSFYPATRFIHKSGDAIQASGSGITLDGKLTKSHKTGAPIINNENTTIGYQGSQKPDQWYGNPISLTAGSIALMDAGNTVLVDGMVYGSRQSSSSANGTITSPEIATLEGKQIQGGCIVVSPNSGRGFAPNTDQSDKSVGRYPDGNDNDENCSDFFLQNSTTLSVPALPGTINIKVASVADFSNGQRIIIGTGNRTEAAIIENVGTAGGTTLLGNADINATVISVGNVIGFSAGQTITIGDDGNMETAVIASIAQARRRFGNTNGPTDSIIVTLPLKKVHTAGTQVSGSGINLSTALNLSHGTGTQISANLPTPGRPNQYMKKP